MSACDAALARLCDTSSEVSSHYLIAASGTVHALVDESRRAWHAGAGAWGMVNDVNSHSIGIELDNPGDRPFPETQMAALTRLLTGVMARWAIPPERVIGHSDMAPDRKSDPGPRFDWRRLAREGLSIWPETPCAEMPPGTPPDLAVFEAALTRIGYPAADPEQRLRAFRLRFRPHATGPLSTADMTAALSLASRFPVDPKARGA